MTDRNVTVIGGGLAGSEAAYQLAVRGVAVTLFEMRPDKMGPAHHTGGLAELVCSNSLKADVGGPKPSAAAMLKVELERMGSLVLAAARGTAVAAGGALAVDREVFSSLVTSTLESMPGVHVVREEVSTLPAGDVIVAAGPLASPSLEPVISALVGSDRLAFFDAAAPIVSADSIDRSICFAASRRDRGGADYLNCPMDRDEYEAFADALVTAERVTRREFETAELFQACQPVEEVIRQGRDAARFGAMKPIGLVDPRTGERPWAVVQLRAEDAARTSFNLVGFQTNLTFAEQKRVFRLIPGLADAEFLRYGVMHRNTFIDSPRLLTPDLALRATPRVRFAGQITGTEGYLEAAGSGLVAALGTFADIAGAPPLRLPDTTALGALIAHATDPSTEPYQPMHVNFGIMPPLVPDVRRKGERRAAFVERGGRAIEAFADERRDLRFDLATAALPAIAPAASAPATEPIPDPSASGARP